jgi:hypothetical protein
MSHLCARHRSGPAVGTADYGPSLRREGTSFGPDERSMVGQRAAAPAAVPDGRRFAKGWRPPLALGAGALTLASYVVAGLVPRAFAFTTVTVAAFALLIASAAGADLDGRGSSGRPVSTWSTTS